MSADVKIESEQIEAVLKGKVIKREVLEGVKAEEAVRKVAKAANKLLKKASVKTEDPLKTDVTISDSATSSSSSEDQVSA